MRLKEEASRQADRRTGRQAVYLYAFGSYVYGNAER